VSGLHARSATGKLQDQVNDAKDLRKEHYVTGQLIGPNRRALDTIAMGVYLVADDVIEAGSTNNLANLTAHVAKKGDFLRINTTANGIEEFEVSIDEIVSANSFRLGAVLSASLEAGDTVSILRPITPRMSATGATLATIDPSPIVFTLNGANQEVTEDTGTPANNRPLPVKLMGVNGTVNLTANDLDISSSHAEDSIRLGDGTNLTTVSAAGELQVRDNDANGSLDDVNTELDAQTVLLTSLESILNSLDGKDYATEVTLEAARVLLASIDGKDFATQTTLAALLTELQLKADLSETQPVSAASLPLPSGASTAAHQVTQNTALTDINSELDSQTALLTTMDADTGNIALGVGATGDAAVTNPASSASIIAALKGLLTLITSTNTKLDTLETNSSPEFNTQTNVTAAGNTLSSAPASARGMIIQNSTEAASALRFTVSGTAPTASVGYFLAPGQSTSYMPAGSVRTISVDGGAIDACIIWFV
jgi:hypothetical protein